MLIRPALLFLPATLAMLLFQLMSCSVAEAQENKDKKKAAATKVEDTDDDFALQGEYTGYIGNYGIQQATGLQVLALGDGKFKVIEYPGGLPGSGWNRGFKYEFDAESADGSIPVLGQDHSYAIDGRFVTVRTYDGQDAGRLIKTKRLSPTLNARPPYNAKVLFDGSSVDHFKNGEIDDDGNLKMGTQFKDAYRAFHLHLEFKLPYMPHARGQGRANSGVYLQSRYEVQVLDSFGLPGVFNECGALYRYTPPNINMCLPPLRWQTYDIYFQAPMFNEEEDKVANARITVLHNGIAVHEDFSLERKTGAGKPEGPNPLPIKLQDHGNPVVFRNIWIVDYSDKLADRSADLNESLMFANLGLSQPLRRSNASQVINYPTTTAQLASTGLPIQTQFAAVSLVPADGSTLSPTSPTKTRSWSPTQQEEQAAYSETLP